MKQKQSACIFRSLVVSDQFQFFTVWLGVSVIRLVLRLNNPFSTPYPRPLISSLNGNYFSTGRLVFEISIPRTRHRQYFVYIQSTPIQEHIPCHPVTHYILGLVLDLLTRHVFSSNHFIFMTKTTSPCTGFAARLLALFLISGCWRKHGN